MGWRIENFSRFTGLCFSFSVKMTENRISDPLKAPHPTTAGLLYRTQGILEMLIFRAQFGGDLFSTIDRVSRNSYNGILSLTHGHGI